ncbi:hypothetical protein [Chryseobacterium terrae]|uniref:Lipocalin-like domain-containing protein n=1 Tax=Chryseobacterium terrae TaxID=3163299 RepID=A0ABW8Y2C2_9FLAO
MSQKNNVLNNDHKYLEGKWKIKNEPFGFFPFNYDDSKCYLNRDAIIEINYDGDLNFISDSCRISKKYKINDFWLEINDDKKIVAYGIIRKNDNNIILSGSHYPTYILKNMEITEEQILKIEKEGFEIELEKIKD